MSNPSGPRLKRRRLTDNWDIEDNLTLLRQMGTDRVALVASASGIIGHTVARAEAQSWIVRALRAA
jgi:hypothetical protein